MAHVAIRSSTDYKCYLCRKKIRRQGDATTIGRSTRPKTVHIWCKAEHETTTASQREAVPILFPSPSALDLWVDLSLFGEPPDVSPHRPPALVHSQDLRHAVVSRRTNPFGPFPTN